MDTNDYGVVTAPRTLRIERTLPGPIERVWDYLTDSQKRRSWLAGGEMELRVGGDLELVFHNAELARDDNDRPPPKHAEHAGEIRSRGTITACDPPRLLGFTWDEGDGSTSEVTFELTSRGDDVQLVLTHRDLATRESMVGVASGWHAHLGVLAARLEGTELPPFWSTIERLEAEYERRVPAGAAPAP